MRADREIRRTGGNGRTSSCVAYNGVLYLSGITSVDIEADVTGQAKDVFTQIDRLLAHNGTDKHRVLQAQVVLGDMGDFGPFNQAWDEWVNDEYEPARSICAAALPLPEFKVMVSLTAALD